MGTAKVLRVCSRLQCLQILWITFNSEENFEHLESFWGGRGGGISPFSRPLIPPCCGKQKRKQGKKTIIKQTIPLVYKVWT